MVHARGGERDAVEPGSRWRYRLAVTPLPDNANGMERNSRPQKRKNDVEIKNDKKRENVRYAKTGDAICAGICTLVLPLCFIFLVRKNARRAAFVLPLPVVRR